MLTNMCIDEVLFKRVPQVALNFYGKGSTGLLLLPIRVPLKPCEI